MNYINLYPTYAQARKAFDKFRGANLGNMRRLSVPDMRIEVFNKDVHLFIVTRVTIDNMKIKAMRGICNAQAVFDHLDEIKQQIMTDISFMEKREKLRW
jgi:hypothetical protein